MALTKKLAAGLTAAMLFTSVFATACDKEVSGTFGSTETTPGVTAESSGSTAAAGTEATTQGKSDDYNFKTSPDKESLFNKYEALTREQMIMLDTLCEPQIGGNDTIIWNNEKEFYGSLSSESKKFAGFKDVKYDEASANSKIQINVTDIKDPDLQKALASYVKNGYSITSVVGENYITYNGERLVGNIFFTTGYHIDSFSQNLITTGFVVKITDELLHYDYTVTKKDGIYQVDITGREMSDIEIEYDPSTGIMAYIIKIDPSDTVG